ncbi:MAG: histidine kinase [Bacteroidales bacterium]|nr:histidine kinase [Bacteroidales bacterium]
MRKPVIQSLKELNQFNHDHGFLHYREKNLKRILLVITIIGILLVAVFHTHDWLSGFHGINLLFAVRLGIIMVFITNLAIAHISDSDKVVKWCIYIGFYISAFYCTLISWLHGGLESSYWGGLSFMLIIWFVFIPFPYRNQILHGIIFIFQYYLILYAFSSEPIDWVPVLEWSFFMSGTLLMGTLVTVLNNRLSANAFYSSEAKTEAEKALKEANKRLTLHIQHSPLAFIEWNEHLEVVDWNPAAEKTFGFTREEAIGSHAYEIIVPEHQHASINKVWENILNKTGGSFNVNENLTKDGRTIICEWYNTPLKNSTGKVIGLASMAQDITARKKLEADLEKSLSMLEKNYSTTLEQMQSYFSELQLKKNELLQLQKENLQSQFEMLKNQVNPHFLFNSLNVLTSLISVEPELAEKFTGQLSKVYRYVLEHRSDDLVQLRTELDFLKSYIFLLRIRFGDKLEVNYRVDAGNLDLKLPPLSLQILIENAIKHNTFTNRSPLNIDIFVDDENYLNVINNYQKREKNMESTGLGLINIANRYSFLTDRPTFFGIDQERFIARIPLL